MTGEFVIAVHALVYLNHRQEYVNSEELAKNICTNPARVRKTMARLKKAGFVDTREGAEGGYFFTGDAEGVSLEAVLSALDERAVPETWRSGHPCEECLISSGMADVMAGITGELDELCRGRLSEISIADINDKIFKSGR